MGDQMAAVISKDTVAKATEAIYADVAIVGGGPAGLAAAVQLRRRGIEQVVVLDRETELGGVPRHCGHPPFGVREFNRLLTGPSYARRLVQEAQAAGVVLLPRHTVTCCRADGQLEISSPNGLLNLTAKRVLLATGVRETPRSARLVSGARPLGVMTTGALQSLWYLKGLVPFKRPVIIGTELVSFSAILTSMAARVRPVAMIESGTRITARQPLGLFPWIKRIPIHLNTNLEAIQGKDRVESVIVYDHTSGKSKTLNCDGVLFTGQFVPEASLIRDAHLVLDPGSQGPEIDQWGRCSDPSYYAAGNLLRAVETAGWSYREGVTVANCIADDLQYQHSMPSGLSSEHRSISLTAESPIKLIVPQRLTITGNKIFQGHRKRSKGFKQLQLRVSRAVKGRLIVETGEGHRLWQQPLNTLPERRISIPIHHWTTPTDTQNIIIRIEDESQGEQP